MVSAIVAMTNIFCFDVFDCGGGAPSMITLSKGAYRYMDNDGCFGMCMQK